MTQETIDHVVLSYVCGLELNSGFSNTLRWRRNGHGGVSNHQHHHCLLNRLFGCRSKKTSKLRVTGLCAGNSPGTGEFPAQMASNAENVSIWWRHLEQWRWELSCAKPWHNNFFIISPEKGLEQKCGISSALVMEILQSTKSPIYCIVIVLHWNNGCRNTVLL